jgi:hypothetical protein
VSESGLRTRVCKILTKIGLDGIAVENPARPGTPDINYINGWIECKKTSRWPAKEETVVQLSHDLMQTQRVWIRRRAKAGGNVFVLVQIDHYFLMFDGLWAVNNLGKKTRKELEDGAVFVVSGWSHLEYALKTHLC